MLPEGIKHPRQGRRQKDKIASLLLFIAGIAFLALAVALAGATAAKELSYIAGEPTWRAAMMSFFYVLCATECFTANITAYAGEVLRGFAQRFSGGERTSNERAG